MNEKEKFLYSILAHISNTNAPLVFKGALITKLILEEAGYDQYERATRDIDASWVDTPPSMESLVKTLNRALEDFSIPISAIPLREYKEHQTAGISFIEQNSGNELFTMDIDIKPLQGSRIYCHGEAQIKGVFPNDIFLDKISSCSSDAIYKWRVKDLPDVFALSHCINVTPKELFTLAKFSNRKISTFEGFYSKKKEIKYAYDKLKNISMKPDFEYLYSYLSEYFTPYRSLAIQERNMCDPRRAAALFAAAKEKAAALNQQQNAPVPHKKKQQEL